MTVNNDSVKVFTGIGKLCGKNHDTKNGVMMAQYLSLWNGIDMTRQTICVSHTHIATEILTV